LPGDRVSLCPGQLGLHSSYFRLPIIAGVTGVCHHGQVFSSFEIGFANCFRGWLENLEPPDLSFLVTLDDKQMPLSPAIG
jgi:hypothetical protein